MKIELEQVTRSLEEAEAALSFGNFDQFHELLQNATQLLDVALSQMNDSMARIDELHDLQQSLEQPAPFPPSAEADEDEAALVA